MQYRARRETQLTGVFMHPSGAMEVRFRKPSFKYKSGQWLFMQVPEVSRWQWCVCAVALRFLWPS
jgi:NADPH oxidase